MILTAARRALGAVSAARPYASAVVEGERDAQGGGALALGEGDPVLTERLGERLGLIWSRVARPLDELVVVVVGRRSDVPRAAEGLAARKAAGGRMLAVLVGTRAERRAWEPVFLAHPGVELDDLAQVSSLDGPGGRAAEQAIVVALGDELLAAARRHPGLRDAVADGVVRRASRRAAVVAALPLAQSDFLVIGTLQIGMVGSIGAIYEREVDAEAVLQAVGVLGAGLGWRALARAGGGLLPPLAPAVRAGIAYSTTRALGELAHARISGGRPLVARIPASARSTVDRVIQRLPGPLGLAGTHEGSSG